MMEKYGVKFYGFCVHFGTRMEILQVPNLHFGEARRI
jgi:hypothetical protein